MTWKIICCQNTANPKPFWIYKVSSKYVSVWCQKKYLHYTIFWRPRTAFFKHFESKWHNGIFQPIQLFVTLCQFYSKTFPVLFTKLQSETIEKEKRSFSFALHIKGGKKSHLQKQLNFWRRILYKQPRLTKWWSSDIFVHIFYSYFRYTGRCLLGCVLFDACCNVTRATWETRKEWKLSYRKKYIEEFVWGTLPFLPHSLLSMSLFIAFFVYSIPLSKWCTCWMIPIKIHNIAMDGTAMDGNGRKYENH